MVLPVIVCYEYGYFGICILYSISVLLLVAAAAVRHGTPATRYSSYKQQVVLVVNVFIFCCHLKFF